MSDDFERSLRARLDAARLPGAPAPLRDRIRAMPAQPAPSPGWSRQLLRARVRVAIVIGVVLLVLAAVVAVSLFGSARPRSVDGLPVMTVSEALAAHGAGTLPDGRAAIQGWWSSGQADHGCAPPLPEPNGEYVLGELELYCHDGEWGITQLDEQMFVVEANSGLVTYQAQGPHLTPFIARDLTRGPELFALPIVNGQRYPPVPIVVVGDFDDPRAGMCRVVARQLCLDRFVLDQIVSFDPAAVPTPGVSPSPTPFPSPGPPGLFAADACAGDVPYSFVGWTTTAELQLAFDRPGHVWAMVTRDQVLLTDGGFADDPNGSGHRFEIFARRICIAEEGAGNEGTMEFGEVPGSAYVLWDDGLKVPGTNPLRP